MDTKPSSDFLRTRDAAKYIDVSESWLRQSRSIGPRKGHLTPPPYYKLGRRIRYRVSDLDAWLEQHRVEPMVV